MIAPGKVSAVDDHAADAGAVAAHKFGHGMDYNVGAVFDGTQKNRSRHGVIDDERNAVFVGDTGQAFDIGDIAGGVADAFAVDGASFVVDEGFDIFGAVGLAEARGDAALGEDVRKQRIGCAVKLRRGNNVVADLDDVNQRIFDGGHAGTDAEGFDSAFERGHTFFEDGVCGIADASVDVARDREIEQGCAVLGAIEFESDGLVDGDGDGFGGGIAVVADVNCDGFSLHGIAKIRERRTKAFFRSDVPANRIRSLHSANHSLGEWFAEWRDDRLTKRELAHVRVYREAVRTSSTAALAGSWENDFARAFETVRAAKSAPKAKRMTGPKLLAAAMPTQ